LRESELPHTPLYNQQALVSKGVGARKVWCRRMGDFFFGLGEAFGRGRKKDPAPESAEPAETPHRRLEDKKPKISD
jgi:hypothetical protein